MFRFLTGRKKLIIQMMLGDLKLCFHGFTFLIFLTGMIWHLVHTKNTIPENRYMADVIIYPERYISFWNLVMQFIYFSMALSLDIEDYIPRKIWNSVRRASLLRIKDYLFSTLLFPFAFFVSVVFWIIYAYDRELVFPVIGEYFLTKYVNHIAHTAVAIFAVLELFFTGNQRKVTFKNCFISVTTIATIYYTVFFYHYIENGRFLYPIFEYLTWYQTVGLLTVSYLWTLLASLIGLRLQQYIKKTKSAED